MKETQVQSLGGEYPLEKEMATHFTTLAWEIPRPEDPGGWSSRDRKESDTTEQVNDVILVFFRNTSISLWKTES